MPTTPTAIRLLLAAILAASSLAPSAQGKEPASPVYFHSLEAAAAMDLPLGAYRALSGGNLGASIRQNLGVALLPWLNPFVEADVSWWLIKPAWVEYGVQCNVLAGASLAIALPAIPRFGAFFLGGGLAYGLMLHVVKADTTGTGATIRAYPDQVFMAEATLGLHFEKGKLGLYLRPRFLVAPDRSGAKQQIGIACGIQIHR